MIFRVPTEEEVDRAYQRISESAAERRERQARVLLEQRNAMQGEAIRPYLETWVKASPISEETKQAMCASRPGRPRAGSGWDHAFDLRDPEAYMLEMQKRGEQVRAERERIARGNWGLSDRVTPYGWLPAPPPVEAEITRSMVDPAPLVPHDPQLATDWWLEVVGIILEGSIQQETIDESPRPDALVDVLSGAGWTFDKLSGDWSAPPTLPAPPPAPTRLEARNAAVVRALRLR